MTTEELQIENAKKLGWTGCFVSTLFGPVGYPPVPPDYDDSDDELERLPKLPEKES